MREYLGIESELWQARWKKRKKERRHTVSNILAPRAFASSVGISLSGMEMGPVALAGSICSWKVAISIAWEYLGLNHLEILSIVPISDP